MAATSGGVWHARRPMRWTRVVGGGGGWRWALERTQSMKEGLNAMRDGYAPGKSSNSSGSAMVLRFLDQY